jgi:ATP-binding cassette, subfamily C (CFTR/MRP), member 1
MAVILVASIVVKSVLLLLPFLVYLVIKLYQYSISSVRETARIESNTKSPLLSFMGETFNGSSTIRAFGREKSFVVENNIQLNHNIMANRWASSVQAWFSLRMDLISISVLAFSTIFCVVYRSQDN